jgi:hypothetical protein
MGVLECDRRGCENIMCDRYSPKHGYLCNECFSEMVETGLTISAFMVTGKIEKDIGYDYYAEEFKVGDGL